MSASPAIALPPRRSRTTRERWATRPDSLPANSHLPRYCAHIQDAFVRRTGPRALLDVMLERSKKLDEGRRILRSTPLTSLCLWTGDELRVLNTGESTTAAEPAPRSSVCYWLAILKRFHLITEWDEATDKRAPRTRGDGRHKTTWIINTWNRALDLLLADDAVATPVNRTFWVLNGRPMSSAQAADWKLDRSVAARMPEAWANNARFYDPDAPIKPLKKTLRAATAADVERIARTLGEWKVPAHMQQVAEILRHAREEQPAIPAEALAEAMSAAMRAESKRQLARNRNAQPSFTVKYFSRDRVRGMATLWKSEHLRLQAEEAREARRAAEATLANPPPDD